MAAKGCPLGEGALATSINKRPSPPTPPPLRPPPSGPSPPKTDLLKLLFSEPAGMKVLFHISKHVGGIQILLNLRGVSKALKSKLDNLPSEIGYELFSRAQAVLNVETENNHQLVTFIEIPPPIFVTSLRLIHAMEFANSNPKEKRDLTRMFVALWSLNSRLRCLEVNHLKLPLSTDLEHLVSSTAIQSFRCTAISWSEDSSSSNEIEFPSFLFSLEELDIVHLDLDYPQRELFWRKLSQSFTLKRLTVRNQFDGHPFADIINSTLNRPEFRFKFGVFKTTEDSHASRNNKKAQDTSPWLFSGLMRKSLKKARVKKAPPPEKNLSPDNSTTATSHLEHQTELLEPTAVLPVKVDTFRSFMETLSRSKADIRLFDLHAHNLVSAAKPDFGLRERDKAKFRSFVRSIDAISEEDTIRLEIYPNLEHVTYVTTPAPSDTIPGNVKEVVIHEARSLSQFPPWTSLTFFQVAMLISSPYDFVESLCKISEVCPNLRELDVGWKVLKDEEKTEITVDDGDSQPQMFPKLKSLKFTVFCEPSNWTNQTQAETRGFLFYQIKVSQLGLRSFDFRRGFDHDHHVAQMKAAAITTTPNHKPQTNCTLPLFNFESFMKLLEVESQIRKTLCIIHIDADFIEDSASSLKQSLMELAHANHHTRFGARRQDYDDYDIDEHEHGHH